MQFPEEVVHEATRHFRIPMINPGEKGEDRAWSHHVVKVRDHVVGVVQRQIDKGEGQRKTRQTANSKHGQEGGGKQHLWRETDGTTPKRDHEASEKNHGRHRDEDCRDLEVSGHHGSHASQVHVMSPHQETQETQRQGCIDHGFVAPERAAGIGGNNFRQDGKSRQNEHIHFGMRQEPEQMLVKQRAAATGNVEMLSTFHQTRRQEETGTKDAIGELKQGSNFQRREGQKEEESDDKHGPAKERQTHPVHAFGAQVDDRSDHVHGTQQRSGNIEYHRKQPPGMPMHPDVRHSEIRRRGQRRVHRPTRLNGTGSKEEAGEHANAADKKEPVAPHVQAGKGHVDGADLQRHHEIHKSSETKRHDAEEHHDGAVHGTKHVVELTIDHAAGCPATNRLLKDPADAGET